MTHPLTLTILGCGGSGGVPVIGGEDGFGFWGNCDPKNPKNQRSRASIHIQTPKAGLLVDTNCDFRQQMLRHGLPQIDAVLYTHAHADHVFGLDDLRAVNYLQKRDMPIYSDATTLAFLKQAFPYAFTAPKGPGGGVGLFYKPQVVPHEITPPQSFDVAGETIQPFWQDHGFTKSMGFRIGTFAYSTDVRAFPEESSQYLHNLDLWIVDCLQREPHNTHAHLAQTLEWIATYKPKRAVLTHMNFTLDYESLRRDLPEGVEPAYDGMRLTV